jgi:hypothetical protein
MGGGMSTVNGSPLINDAFFCENTPDHIWGPWDGDDNTFHMFCLPLPVDIRGDGGTGDVQMPVSR